MNALSYRGAIGEPLWGTLAGALRGHLRYLLAMRVDDFATEPWEGQDLTAWEWAWAFGPDAELKWRADEGRAWAVAAWDGGPDLGSELPAGEPVTAASSFRRVPGNPATVRLWGVSSPNGFVEGRFARTLHYPVPEVPNGRRVCLLLQEYLDEAGEVAWLRAVDLRAEE